MSEIEKTSVTNAAPGEMDSFGINKMLLTGLAAGLIGILSTSAMYNPAAPPAYRMPAAGVVIAAMFLLSGFRIGKFSNWRLLSLFFWTGFAMMSIVSAMNHRDPLLAELWQLVGVPLVFFTAFPRTANRYGNIMVMSATALAFAPYIIVSLFKYPLFFPYAGVFENSNMFGMVISTFSAALFGLLRGSLNQSKRTFLRTFWVGALGLCLIASFVLITFSGSRTSFITFFLMYYLVFVGTLFFDASKHRLALAISIIGFMMAVFYSLYNAAMSTYGSNIVDTLLGKFFNKITQGDVTSGRMYIWKSALEDVQVLGMGNSYFYEEPAHNSYIMILATKGPLAALFMIAVHITTLFLAVQRLFHDIRQDGYAIGPLLIVSNFLILGLAENVFGTLGNGINMTFLLMAGILFNGGQIRKPVNQEMERELQ